jgi:alpha-D-ribose 1-methylphosphonate 5-triphosphate diphosphatase
LLWRRAPTAAGLDDRGIIVAGRRADLILVDTQSDRPRVVATIVAGRIVHLVEADRIGSN